MADSGRRVRWHGRCRPIDEAGNSGVLSACRIPASEVRSGRARLEVFGVTVLGREVTRAGSENSSSLHLPPQGQHFLPQESSLAATRVKMGEGGGGRGAAMLMLVMMVAVSLVTADENLNMDYMNPEALGSGDEEMQALLSDGSTEAKDLQEMFTGGKPRTVGDLLRATYEALDHGQVQLIKSLKEQAHRYNKGECEQREGKAGVRVEGVRTHVHDNYLYIVLGSSHSRLVSVVCVGIAARRAMLPQVITRRGVLGALHLMPAGGNLYLVVGESHYSAPGDGKGRSGLYKLVGDFFDEQENLNMDASGVRDITSFSSSSKRFIVLGMENSDGSRVYALHTRAHRFTQRAMEHQAVTLTLAQRLDERRVLRLATFRDQTDLKHFVVVLRRVSPSVVYWWNGHRLARWQTLDTHHAPAMGGSLALLPLSNYEHLIFASAGAVRDMQATQVGQDYMLLYVCEGPVNRLEARLVHLEDLSEGSEPQSQVISCLDDLRAKLDARRKDVASLQQVVDADLLMTVDRPQVWSGPISVPEVWVEQKSSLQHTVVIPPGSGGNKSLGEYESLVTRLQAEVKDIQAGLGSVLYYTGAQTVHNLVSAASLVTSQAHFDVVSVSRLHGVPLTSLSHEVLLDGADQIIAGHFQIAKLSAQRLTTRGHHPPGSINGMLTADFMRLSVADQVVTGRHNYRSLTAGRICHTHCDQNLPIMLNGLDTSTLVTHGAHVTFTARKTFRRVLIRDALDVATINGVSLAELFSQVIFTDVGVTQVLGGRHAIQRLTVGGNLNVGAVNGVNVAELEQTVVKKHGDYRLAGSLVYKRDLTVRGDAAVHIVNGVTGAQIFLLDIPVTVTGFYNFARATVTGALRSDNINGVNLSEEAVLLDLDQNIQGRVRFLQSVKVTGPAGVRMGDGATVNGVDPSEVAAGKRVKGVTSTGGTVTVVVEERMNVTSMTVSGNIVIASVNGMDLTDLERRFWRKSVAQEINVAVHIRNAVFLGGVEGSTLNGHAITDYLRLNANQRITGRYTFQGRAEVRGNLVVAKGRKVAGVEVSTLTSRIVTMNTGQTIEGEVIFSGRVTVVNDMDVRGDFTALQVLSRALRLDQTYKAHWLVRFIRLSETLNPDISKDIETH
ncbi:hypothetical protein GWK47_032875 [Chionoecetes opilio]|uniref:Uncharacterized protein n=1 Tax=Chionoecetes opilio TaxID=41210 RepID=A0A8J5D1E9_CHIOP|nr:hypothetical protein GWK47_032875 [Chionoecetes opilio]